MDEAITDADAQRAGHWQGVMFRLGGQYYGLPLAPVLQILPMLTIVPIPQLDTVAGVINVHGTAVPVVDLRHHLRLPEAALQVDTPLILARVGGRQVGLVVDEVTDVVSLTAEQVAIPKDVLPDGLGEAPVLGGVANATTRPVLLLDPTHLFLPHQREALARAAEFLAGREAQP